MYRLLVATGFGVGVNAGQSEHEFDAYFVSWKTSEVKWGSTCHVLAKVVVGTQGDEAIEQFDWGAEAHAVVLNAFARLV